MHLWPLKLVETWDVRPLACTQNPGSVDEDIKLFPFRLVIGILDRKFPDARCVVPFCSQDTMVELAVAVQLVFLSKVPEVSLDLFSRSVDPGPLRFGFKGVRVIVCLIVTFAPISLVVSAGNRPKKWIMQKIIYTLLRGASLPGISVLKPDPTNIIILLIDGQAEIFKGALQLVSETQPRCASTDAGDPHVSL